MRDAPIIPGYRILRQLGIGGMASVYLALQESLEREVALKVMAPALAANQEFTARFLKEGKITAKLIHPHLVTVYDIGQFGTAYYLATEYIPGGTLRDRLAKSKCKASEALRIACEVALALEYVHEKGFVHRDVKPGNILFRANGSAVLADFGIAKSINQKTMSTQAGNSIGTPHYMSPEQARAEKVDGRSDLYSLGTVFYETLVGAPPYEATDPFTIGLMHVNDPVPQLPEALAQFQPLLDRLMAKDPCDRYFNGQAFITDCESLIAEISQFPNAKEVLAVRKRLLPQALSASSYGAAQSTRALPSQRQRAVSNGFAKKMAMLAPIALLAAAGAWWMLRDKKASDMTTVPIEAPQDANADRPVIDRPPVQSDPVATVVPHTDLTQSEIPGDLAAMLHQAHEYMKVGLVENGRRISSPPGDCALDLYLRVLAEDPDNIMAKQGLSQIAAFYESKAKAAFDRGVFSGSMVLAEIGLKAEPSNASLQKLFDDSKMRAGN